MKSWVIALQEIPASRRLGERCVASGRKQGWDIELFNGFWGNKGREWLASRGYPLLRPVAPHYDDSILRDNASVDGEAISPGLAGSIASHVALWERCVEVGDPIAIFEHDAKLVAPPPVADFTHCLVLGPSPRLMARHGTLVRSIDPKGPAVQPLHFMLNDNQRCIPLAICYALTPVGAELLLKDLAKWGGAPIDVQIRHPVVSLSVLAKPVCTFQFGYKHNPSLTASSSGKKLKALQKGGMLAWWIRKIRRYCRNTKLASRDYLRRLILRSLRSSRRP